MRLIKARCVGYKRLHDSGDLDLDLDVVCIVGPNAAGKSSFLDALTHLNDDRAFESHERTRRNRGDGLIKVQARFVLEPDDRATIAQIPEAADLRQVIFYKRHEADPNLQFEPRIHRDLTPRREVEGRIRKLRDTPWASARAEQEVDGDEPILLAIDAALPVLASDDERLVEDELAPVVALHDLVASADDLPHQARALPSKLDELLAHEQKEHPHNQVWRALFPRMPKFLKFGQDERALQPSYDLTNAGDEAIQNLLRLAGTSYERARTVAREGDKGRKKVFLDRANRELERVFTVAWGQNNILNVSIDLDGMLLTS